MSDKEARAVSAREAYLQNQQAVAANAESRRRWTPFAVVSLAGAVLTVALYAATVVSCYNDAQQQGSTDITLPALTSFLFMATVYSLVLPYLIEARTPAKRIRNAVVAAVPTAVLALVGIAIFIDLGSLLADLLYNLSR